MEISDEVVAAAARGDHESVALIYRSLSPKVVGYLRARGVEDPEGLANDVFMAVLPRLRRLVGGAAGLRTLTFSVAHARSVDDIRRQARAPFLASYDPEADERREPSAEATALRSTGARQALEMLGRLSAEQEAVIGLRVVADLSLEETAAVLGKSVGAVKQLQRRGLIRLKSLMERGEVTL